MSVRYTLRMQFGPHQDTNEIRDEILRVCRDGQADEVMFFAFAEEQNDGHDPIERIAAWMDAIRPWKRALEAAGVDVSLNPWHSLLHTDRCRTLKPDQNWQPMVDWRGRAASAVVCPLDPGWRAYYAEAMARFAAEKFRVIWIDDDIRYHNHAPLDWGGCWCPLHLAEFCRGARATVGRDEIVAAIVAPGAPHPWRQIWFDMWDQLHCELIASWRAIVEPQGCRLGLMSSDPETHSMEGRQWPAWWRALAGDNAPVHRPHFWGYGDGPPAMLVRGIGLMQQNRIGQPAAIESDPEIENHPYGPWNKSRRQTTAQMALAQIFGSSRLAVSLYDFMGNLPSDEPERPAYLAQIKPLLAWLGDRFPRTLEPAGIGSPWDPAASNAACTDGRVDWRALHVPGRTWDAWLGPFGLAFQKSTHPAVNALAGPMAWTLDDATLRDWLARGLLLDGPAAAILVERRLFDLVGITDIRFVTQAQCLYSMEESVDAEFGLRPGAQMSLNVGNAHKARVLQGGLLDGARAISLLRDPLQRPVGHGAVVFENALGGRVAVMPWDAAEGADLSSQRCAQFRRVIDWLARGASTGSVAGGAWLVPQFFTDGAAWRGVVWNGSPDAIASFSVRPPDAMGPIAAAVHCDAAGRRTPAAVHDNTVNLAAPMHQWEFVVLNPGD